MNLTKNSNSLIKFFVKNNCLNPIRQTKKTNTIFKTLYHEIMSGFSYINSLKHKMKDRFYKLKITDIHNIKQIPKPQTFPANGFPNIVRQHIDEHTLSSLHYSFNLFDRNIDIYFLIEDNNAENLTNTYNTYVDYMLVWLYIVNGYASRHCSPHLKIFIYFTSLMKNIPSTNVEILNEAHVNTAFTRTCPSDSEIVVFRKEEWYKVFIHETFHNFGLDFSDMNNSACHSKILALFPVKSDVNIFESYSECWARIMNVLFCSFTILKDKTNFDEFLINTQFFINIERIYSFFQMVKVLNFMDISYCDLYSKTAYAENIRKTFYKEQTSVLSYYVLTTILINNYQDFLSWCRTNNTSLLQFKKTTSNQHNYCKFIEKKYKSKSLLDDIDCTENLLLKLKKSSRTKKGIRDLGYLVTNLRMSVCELG